MKTLIALLITVSIATPVDASGPLYKSFLVDNQPLPAVVFVQHDLDAGKANFNPENSKQDNNTSHKRSSLDISPLLLSNKVKSFSSIGAGYVRDDFELLNTAQINSNYSGAYLSLFAIGEFAQSWYASLYASYGNFSNKGASSHSSGNKWIYITTAGYKRSSQVIYRLGVLHSFNFGDDVVLPVLGMSYSNASYVFDILLPSHISVRKVYSDTFHAVAKTELVYSSYYDADRKDALEISGMETSVAVEYEFIEHCWLKLGVTYTGEKQLRWIDTDSDIAKVDATYKVFTGFEMRY